MRGWLGLSLVLALLWIVVDWQQRFSQTEDAHRQGADSLKMEQTFNASLSPERANELKELYSKYGDEQQSRSEDVSDPMLEAQRQAEQSGRLTEVYSGDHKISLIAVISDANTGKKQVLLSVTHIPDASTHTEAVLNGGNKYGYRVQVISSTQVDLYRQNTEVDETNSRSADISLVMYR